MVLREEIISLECATWEALKRNGEALIPFLSSDCVMLFPGAPILSSTSDPPLTDILMRPDMKPWISYKMSNVHVLDLHGAASISYEVVAQRHEQEYKASITSIWREDRGGWRMCLHQQTPTI